ncbi:Hypothetical_protein [Hexamita inflata]|uniref:Hypothetical_protein n=1 Tax=Hexamita inflata TaxID=28002 RepID=A0AA86P0Q2_9EUKA|nr:Hypothetical protein HINF_LOCUS17098 [Hexamita inflata]
MILILILTYQNCLDASHGNIAQLTGILKQYTWYLNFSIKQNCSQLVGNNMQVQLRFQNQQLPLNMIQVQTKLNQTGFQIIQFVQDELTYKKLLHIASVDYIVLIDQIQYIGVVHNVKQIRVDTRQCWDKVTFSADRDWAFNISVIPNNCVISNSVTVTLEYFKEQWLSVPIIPTNAIGQFQGYQVGAFIVNNVLFFNTSAEVDTLNAQLIIDFVEHFKKNFNVRLRMKVQENDNLNNILNLFQIDILYLGNYLSKLAQPQPPTCTVDTWYALTITVNQPLRTPQVKLKMDLPYIVNNTHLMKTNNLKMYHHSFNHSPNLVIGRLQFTRLMEIQRQITRKSIIFKHLFNYQIEMAKCQLLFITLVRPHFHVFLNENIIGTMKRYA